MNTVIYHANCTDGFSASVAAAKALPGDTVFIAGEYDKPLPHVELGSRVYLLDLSYKAPEMNELIGRSSQLIVLDHHVTAQRALTSDSLNLREQDILHFDMTKSGAVLAWEHFFPQTQVPEFFRFVQARDLWTWDAPNAAEYLQWLDTLPMDRALWSLMIDEPEANRAAAIATGSAMLSKLNSIAESVATRATEVSVAGVRGLMVNAPSELVNEVGALLAARCGSFGLVWSVAKDGSAKVSLRSVKEGSAVSCDVESLARKFDGGGHPSSSAFRMSLPLFFKYLEAQDFAPSSLLS